AAAPARRDGADHRGVQAAPPQRRAGGADADARRRRVEGAGGAVPAAPGVGTQLRGHFKTPPPAPPRSGEGRAALPPLPASGRGWGRGSWKRFLSARPTSYGSSPAPSLRGEGRVVNKPSPVALSSPEVLSPCTSSCSPRWPPPLQPLTRPARRKSRTSC